jgi:hypothetical protein
MYEYFYFYVTDCAKIKFQIMFLCGNTQQKNAENRSLLVLFRSFVFRCIYIYTALLNINFTPLQTRRQTKSFPAPEPHQLIQYEYIY